MRTVLAPVPRANRLFPTARPPLARIVLLFLVRFHGQWQPSPARFSPRQPLRSHRNFTRARSSSAAPNRSNPTTSAAKKRRIVRVSVMARPYETQGSTKTRRRLPGLEGTTQLMLVVRYLKVEWTHPQRGSLIMQSTAFSRRPRRHRSRSTRLPRGVDLTTSNRPAFEGERGRTLAQAALVPVRRSNRPIKMPILPSRIPLQLSLGPRRVFEAHARHRRQIDGRLAVNYPRCECFSHRWRD